MSIITERQTLNAHIRLAVDPNESLQAWTVDLLRVARKRRQGSVACELGQALPVGKGCVAGGHFKPGAF